MEKLQDHCKGSRRSRNWHGHRSSESDYNYILAEWKFSTVVTCYKGKKDFIEKWNYMGLKLTDQILTIAKVPVDNVQSQDNISVSLPFNVYFYKNKYTVRWTCTES